MEDKARLLLLLLFITFLLPCTYTCTTSDVLLDILFEQAIYDTSVPLLQLVAIMVPVFFLPPLGKSNLFIAIAIDTS